MVDAANTNELSIKVVYIPCEIPISIMVLASTNIRSFIVWSGGDDGGNETVERKGELARQQRLKSVG